MSREYVAALESRIASLESLLGNLKAADGDERNQILDDLEVQDYVPSFSGLPLADEIALSEAMTKASFQEMTDGISFSLSFPFFLVLGSPSPLDNYQHPNPLQDP